jgi:hypothetical protein
LSAEEEKKNKEMYFALKLYELGNVEIDETCMILPKIYTYINVKSNSIDQQTKIDESCKVFKVDPREKIN